MKEMCLKNRISKDKSKREYCIEEVISEGGYLKKTLKNCSYSVKRETRFACWRDLLAWISHEKVNDPKSLKEVSVKRSFDSKTGEAKVHMKIAGKVYAKLKGEIFSIRYEHSLEYGMLKD